MRVDEHVGQRLDAQRTQRRSLCSSQRRAGRQRDQLRRRIREDRHRIGAGRRDDLVGEDAAHAGDRASEQRGVPGRGFGGRVCEPHVAHRQPFAPQAREAAVARERGPALVRHPRAELVDDDDDQDGRAGRGPVRSGLRPSPRAGEHGQRQHRGGHPAPRLHSARNDSSVVTGGSAEAPATLP